LSALFNPASFCLKPLALLFLALSLLFGLFAPFFLLEGLALLSQLLLILKFFGFFQQSGPLKFILLLQESLFGFPLLLCQISLFFLHCLTFKALSFNSIFSFSRLSLLSLIFLLGNGGKLSFLLGFGVSQLSLFTLDLLTLFQDSVLFIATSLLIFSSLALMVSFFLLAPSLLFFFNSLETSFFLLLKNVPSLTILFLDCAKPRLLLELEFFNV
jgi:hypothetical protein